VSRLGWLLVAIAAAGYMFASPFLLQALRAYASPLPPIAMLVLQFVQTMVLVALAAWAGVRFAPRVGLDAPWLRAVAERRERPPDFGSMVIEALAVGSVAAIAVTGLLLPLRPAIPEALWRPIPAGFWTRVTSAFYGGTVEEILVRWGLLSALFLLARRLQIDGFWPANVAAALVFGALHLPALRLFHMPLSGAVVAWVLAGNGIAGVVFGWLFRRRGLEGAMIAHAAADLWLQALLPVLLA
jgi:membrane protease YdiL (CAAX protease family)